MLIEDVSWGPSPFKTSILAQSSIPDQAIQIVYYMGSTILEVGIRRLASGEKESIATVDKNSRECSNNLK